jgi:hypothetical protein
MEAFCRAIGKSLHLLGYFIGDGSQYHHYYKYFFYEGSLTYIYVVISEARLPLPSTLLYALLEPVIMLLLHGISDYQSETVIRYNEPTDHCSCCEKLPSGHSNIGGYGFPRTLNYILS